MFAKFLSWLITPVVAALCKDDRLITALAGAIDNDDIAAHIADSKKVEEIAKHIDTGHLAEVICDTLDTDDICARVAKDISASDVAQQLDLDDIQENVKDSIDVDARSVAGEIDMSELARELDVSDIANEIDLSELANQVDMDAVIENLVNGDDCIDYTALAKALIRELGAASKVECRPSAT